eukprot:TRINITY_DN38194_c0_g1_i1.p1 TRINITY_DN38194_c0_g1~~TRINITY_DN38194_c0_g1_i1.p1  ORF type:complete len:548 (+),score=132.94 TRINITY_DN38194_c0_g1_i1:145-1788(+)
MSRLRSRWLSAALLVSFGVAAEAFCSTGQRSGAYCCAGSCGQCGGSGCGGLPGGSEKCCTSWLKDAARCCADASDEACIIEGEGVSCTAATPSPTASPTQDEEDDEGGMSVGLVAGIAGGVLLLLGGLAALFFYLRRRSASKFKVSGSFPQAQRVGGNSVERLRQLLEEDLQEDEFRWEVEAFCLHGLWASSSGSADAATFHRCGRMEEIVGILQNLAQSVAAGGSLDDLLEAELLGDALEKAARRRLLLSEPLAQRGNGAPAPKNVYLYALLCAKELRAMQVTELDAVASRYQHLRNLPETWDVRDMLEGFGLRLLQKTPIDDDVREELQKLLDDTFKAVKTRDRKGRVPKRLCLTGAVEVQNANNWMEYVSRRSAIREDLQRLGDRASSVDVEELMTMQSTARANLPELDVDVREAWLFHGTSALGAEGITSEDFKLDLAGSNVGTLYGRGLYFAECCTKSDEYAGKEDVELRYLLLCRVILGNINLNDDVAPDADELVRSCTRGEFHSVLGDRAKARGTYKELIVYDNDQVYPAYILEYQQQFE